MKKRFELQMKNFFSIIDDPVFILNSSGEWIYSNNPAMKFFAIPPEEMSDKMWCSVIPRNLREIFHENDLSIINTEKTKITIQNIFWKDNLNTFITKKSVFANMFTGEKFLVYIIRNISHHISVMEYLLENDVQLNSLIQNLNNAIAILKPGEMTDDFIIEDFNNIFREMNNIAIKSTGKIITLFALENMNKPVIITALKKVWETGKMESITIRQGVDSPSVQDIRIDIFKSKADKLVMIYGEYTGSCITREPVREKSKFFKYKNSNITGEESKRLFEKLNRIIRESKIYLDPDLTLDDVAAEFGVSRNIVSQIINENTNRNFREYINKFRVEEAKNQLLNLEKQHKTLLDIAFEVGFNSKSSFNLNFKKQTGVTPSYFIKLRRTKGRAS